MSERLKSLRISVRAALAIALIIAIVIIAFMLVRELPDDPNDALVSMLGTFVGGLGTSLVILIQAVARNPNDSDEGD